MWDNLWLADGNIFRTQPRCIYSFQNSVHKHEWNWMWSALANRKTPVVNFWLHDITEWLCSSCMWVVVWVDRSCIPASLLFMTAYSSVSNLGGWSTFQGLVLFAFVWFLGWKPQAASSNAGHVRGGMMMAVDAWRPSDIFTSVAQNANSMLTHSPVIVTNTHTLIMHKQNESSPQP